MNTTERRSKRAAELFAERFSGRESSLLDLSHLTGDAESSRRGSQGKRSRWPETKESE